jgi:hypothetical protein
MGNNNTPYRDNYPHNIEAPQRVYVQYSQDIENFDYSDGKYPLGEDYEGFVWESIYIPVPHKLGDEDIGRHVWMRWRVGDRTDWTVPMRFTDAYSNITTTSLEEVVGTDQVRFRFQYTLDSGEIIYSEYITLTNGSDGRGIVSSDIRSNNLYLTYSDGIEEEVGRVVGYDGNGFPSFGSDVSGNIIRVDSGGNPIWEPFLDALNDNLSATSPINYTNGVISHVNTDGNKHIPIGGSNGNLLSTDGSGTYSWYDIDTELLNYIPWLSLDDTAGAGDTDKLYSADKIVSLITASIIGIKYSVLLYSDLASILTPSTGELAVVTSDPLYPNRPVYRYNGATWDSFFDLDADHNHDNRYYTETELNSSGAGGQVHWDNITNKPTFFEDFDISGDSGSGTITDGETLGFIGGTGITTSVSGNNVTINASASLYTEGGGIDITGNVISHENTSSVVNTTNTGGQVIQNETFDTYGHVLTRSSINLDGRYSLLTHTHANLTPGTGISGSAYNGSTARTWNLAYAGSGGNYGSSNNVARSDHTHWPNSLETGTFGTTAPPASGRINVSYTKKLYFGDYLDTNNSVIEFQMAIGNSTVNWNISYGTLLGTINNGRHAPTQNVYHIASCGNPSGNQAITIPILIQATTGNVYAQQAGTLTIPANTYLAAHMTFVR